jgi:hypothetical protein
MAGLIQDKKKTLTELVNLLETKPHELMDMSSTGVN